MYQSDAQFTQVDEVAIWLDALVVKTRETSLTLFPLVDNKVTICKRHKHFLVEMPAAKIRTLSV